MSIPDPHSPHSRPNPRRTLTADQARDIYRRYWADEPLVGIAAAHGINAATVRAIGIRYTYRDATAGLEPQYPVGTTRPQARRPRGEWP
jgi:hypothetical protein